MKEINKEIIIDIINALPQEKVITLMNACYRNYLLTTTYELSKASLHVCKEGYYLELEGTRCGFNVFAKDNDGELEITRKPHNLTELYVDFGHTNFIDFNQLA